MTCQVCGRDDVHVSLTASRIIPGQAFMSCNRCIDGYNAEPTRVYDTILEMFRGEIGRVSTMVQNMVTFFEGRYIRFSTYAALIRDTTALLEDTREDEE